MVRGPGPAQPSPPWDALALLGALLWPVGLLFFGGFDEDAGTAIVAAGCLVVIASLAAEFALRQHAQRRRADGA